MSLPAFIADISIVRTFQTLSLITLLLLVVMSVISFYRHKNTKELHDSQDQITAAYRIAEKLRANHEHQTSLARRFVTTGDMRDYQAYRDELDVRRGLKANIEGHKQSFLNLIKEHGFSENEVELLTEAILMTDKLAATESLAMGAVLNNRGETERQQSIMELSSNDYYKVSTIFEKTYFNIP